MLISYVLRLRPDGLQDGRFRGEMEAVATGRRFALQSIEQLIGLVFDTVDDETDRVLAAGRGREVADR